MIKVGTTPETFAEDWK